MSSRISSSRLMSVKFVMRVHWIMSVCCGGIIIVPTADCSGRVSWLVSLGFMISGLAFWLSFIWFVVEFCCTRSASVRNVTTWSSLSWGISTVLATSSTLCHTLSSRRFSIFSSFVDNSLPLGTFVQLAAMLLL